MRIPGALRNHPGDVSLLLAGFGSALYPLALVAWGLLLARSAHLG